MFMKIIGVIVRIVRNKQEQNFLTLQRLVHIGCKRVNFRRSKLSDRITFTEKSITGVQFQTVQLPRIALMGTGFFHCTWISFSDLTPTYKLSIISYSNCVSLLMLLLNVIGNFEERSSIILRRTPLRVVYKKEENSIR